MALEAMSNPDSFSSQLFFPGDPPDVKPGVGLLTCSGELVNFTGFEADPLKIEFGAPLPGDPLKIKSEPGPSSDLKTEVSGDGYQEGKDDMRLRRECGTPRVPPAAMDRREARYRPERRPPGCPVTDQLSTRGRHLQAPTESHGREEGNKVDESSGQGQQERFRCHVCCKPFPCRSWLEKHARTHSGEKPFSCKFCQRAFTQRSSLNKHVRGQHSGESKPFRCNVCEKSFSTKCYLRVHEASHNGDCQATCKVCERTFSHVKLLKIHLKVHSGRFRCEVCDKAFACQSKLDTHAHRHSVRTSFECGMCPGVFRSCASLNRHVGMKHPEPTKPFGCDDCGKRFSTKRYLLVHASSHTTEHQVSCDICSRSFSHQRLLYLHRKSHARQGRRDASRRVADA